MLCEGGVISCLLFLFKNLNSYNLSVYSQSALEILSLKFQIITKRFVHIFAFKQGEYE